MLHKYFQELRWRSERTIKWLTTDVLWSLSQTSMWVCRPSKRLDYAYIVSSSKLLITFIWKLSPYPIEITQWAGVENNSWYQLTVFPEIRGPVVVPPATTALRQLISTFRVVLEDQVLTIEWSRLVKHQRSRWQGQRPVQWPPRSMSQTARQ